MVTVSPTTVVAITRLMGSGGHDIADRVAKALDLPLFDREIISSAASAAGVEPDVINAAETVPSLITRIVEQLGRYPLPLLETEGLAGTAFPPDLMMTSADYRELIDRVVRQIAAQQSAVIFGHAATQTLRDHPGVVRVLLLAPREARVRRYAMEQGVSEEKAKQTIQENDRARSDFFKRYYDVDWLDARRYDLSINTVRTSDDTAVGLIVYAAQARMGRRVPER